MDHIRGDLDTLEAMACVEVLVIANNMKITKLSISSYWLEVINMIMVKNLCSYNVVLGETEKRACTFEAVKFHHEIRESSS
jgi:hypothetical protein